MTPRRVFALPRQQSLFLPAVLNPFVQEVKLAKADIIKCVFRGIFLVPIRAIFLTLVLMVTWPVAVITTFMHPLKGAVAPMTGWRRFMCRRVMAFLGRSYYFFMGFRVVVKGQQVSSAGAPILVVAPHSTFFDGIVCIVAGLPSTVSRTENLATPIFGRFVRCLQPVLVSRQDPDSRKNTIMEIDSRAKSGGRWPQILVFPEGTCTNRSCLITFKQGAFVPGVPVQPVIMRYPNRLDTVTWTWQGFSSKTLLLLTLSQLYTNVEIEFLPPVTPTEEEKKIPVLFARRVRNVMAQALGVPVTDHTYEDCRLMISAGELTLPMEADWLLCRSNTVLLPLWQHSMSCYDGDGTIDFREYVIGVTILCRPANTKEVLRTAFQLFDTDEDQRITHEEFSSMLRSALGVCDLNVSKLFKEIDTDSSEYITFSEFEAFALNHPEYAKLFTTYLELQRYQALQGVESELSSTNHVCSEDNQEDSISDKKDD
uniref:Lysophosphatidylcholine acyltransferase 2 n=1 Tax=Hucho hucho TaxID=62062 RepID=A0A4W5K9C5_9TELE